MNLGTPDAATQSAVRAFLRNFLSDPRVVELPKLLWLPILYGFILPFRPKRVVNAYRAIWTENGSPLRVMTQRQVSALQEMLGKEETDQYDAPHITYAMAYGGPSLEKRVKELTEIGVERILVLPLYPQYSATTTGSIYDQYADLVTKSREVPDIIIHKHYYRRTDYINALAESVEACWQQSGRSQRLLLSYHGIPQRCVDLGDPYYRQCRETSEALANVLGLTPDQWAISFQSRLGAARWLQPYTDQLLVKWANSGVKSVDVMCPAFSSDCLETLEEINVENRRLFCDAGGESFSFIPCLNDNAAHISMMACLIKEYIR